MQGGRPRETCLVGKHSQWLDARPVICGLEFWPTNHAVKLETRCGKLGGGSYARAWVEIQPEMVRAWLGDWWPEQPRNLVGFDHGLEWQRIRGPELAHVERTAGAGSWAERGLGLRSGLESRAWAGARGLSHNSGYACRRKERKRKRKEKEEEETKIK
ncbi:hypothetical protein TIFTF001_042000 [Ficus carica]|uniref:Uncharacterized protein n=1 Tax=Ficus carica TaxID=3494 RepID=A0AA88CY11_FICCA|nr:hypothetical protein TIFTF001_042000 [Ficus carica]